jgi:subtilisin family serine protease
VRPPLASPHAADKAAYNKITPHSQKKEKNMTNLTGEGVIIAVLDSGIDYSLQNFKNENGTSKIIEIYDQETGTSYSRNMINTAIESNPAGILSPNIPIRDNTGHGTAVAAIAAGIAVNSDLLIIKLGKSANSSFPLTTQLMRGIDYAINYAVNVNKPLVINISYGNTYGDHKGNSLIERFIDNASEIGKTSIVIGSGNEGASNGHISGIAFTEKVIELVVDRYETGFSIQIWKYYQDVFDIKVISPGGEELFISGSGNYESQTLRKKLEETDLLCFLGQPQPYSVEQEIFIDFIPENDYITQGVWQIILTPIVVVTGEYRLYLSGYATRNTGTGFLKPTPDMTITIPSTSRKAISVGAYDAAHRSYADFSGRGYVYRYNENIDNLVAQVKPDVSAPGVDITVPLPGGGYEKVSGTSFAAPYVAGMCALLMEWGIVRKNDIYLYGERLKALLIKKAQPLELNQRVPNSKIGWGKVDFLR